MVLLSGQGNQRRCPGSKIEFAGGRRKAYRDADRQKTDELQKDQDDISAEAKQLEVESADHLHQHAIFGARRDTVSNCDRNWRHLRAHNRKSFWMVSLAFGVVGVALVIQGAFRALTASRPGKRLLAGDFWIQDGGRRLPLPPAGKIDSVGYFARG